jgi:GrpB-like predicted nucleotidyltransferase (UPF0157 family)
MEIVGYQERWPGEFHALGQRLRDVLGDRALRIDHIGSTAVPGLAAKDVIDVQVTVSDLDQGLVERMTQAGFRPWRDLLEDHTPPGRTLAPEELRKRLFNLPLGERKANIHLRVEGRFNQRYPLLCRDYLRTHRYATDAYAQVKRALARVVGDDIDAYYDVKDPVFDILMTGAEDWAIQTGWQPGPSDA